MATLAEVIRARNATARAIAFYERGLARLEDRWLGGGSSGDRFVDDRHLYANDLDLFGPDGKINHPDRLRVLLDAVVTQELGPSHCPQPPRGESWIGCRVDDGMFNRAVELFDQRRGPTEKVVSR